MCIHKSFSECSWRLLAVGGWNLSLRGCYTENLVIALVASILLWLPIVCTIHRLEDVGKLGSSMQSMSDQSHLLVVATAPCSFSCDQFQWSQAASCNHSPACRGIHIFPSRWWLTGHNWPVSIPVWLRLWQSFLQWLPVTTTCQESTDFSLATGDSQAVANWPKAMCDWALNATLNLTVAGYLMDVKKLKPGNEFLVWCCK